MEPSFLRTRSFDPGQREIMDDPGVRPEELAVDLKNLTLINRYFGGWSACRAVLSCIEKETAGKPDTGLTWLDCAAGAGDLPRYMAKKTKIQVRFILLDLNASTLEFAGRGNASDGFHCQRVQANMLNLPFADNSIDIVTCQLALHHFSTSDAVRILRELRRVSRRFVFVTDIIRSRTAYFGIWCLVKFWLRHPMTQHDALLSIRRAFTTDELRALAETAGWNKIFHKTLPWFRQALWLNKAEST